MKGKKVNEWAKIIHEYAKAHGWWDKERSDGEILALCHSELSEALEEYRNGKPMLYYVDDKPEGIAVELADCVIRILDYLGYKEQEFDGRVAEYISGNCEDFGTFISEMHSMLSATIETYYNYRRGVLEMTIKSAYCTSRIIYDIHNHLKANNIDLWEIVRIKHEYNVTRPYRHGGKVI